MSDATTTTTPTTQTRTATRTAHKPVRPRLWNVVLADSDDHTYEYVIELMVKVFAHPLETAFDVAKTVDTAGRAICCTTHRERAELKLEQIQGFGADPRIASCAGPMSAYLEPAAGDDDHNDD